MDEPVSSAEITAIYRSSTPSISGDNLSEKLIGETGKVLAKRFIDEYEYPLVERKVSVSAGYCLREACRLLHTGHYDSCISFASGFSLLLYCIARKVDNAEIYYCDTDLPQLICEREARILSAVKRGELQQALLKRICQQVVDVIAIYQEKIPLKTLFPKVTAPVFILEGLSFFLPKDCLHWFIQQLGTYENAAVILNYWPEDIASRSAIFSKAFPELNQGMILETLYSLWDQETAAIFQKAFPHQSDWEPRTLDKMMAAAAKPVLKPVLLDDNEYFILKLLTGVKQAEDVGPFNPMLP